MTTSTTSAPAGLRLGIAAPPSPSFDESVNRVDLYARDGIESDLTSLHSEGELSAEPELRVKQNQPPFTPGNSDLKPRRKRSTKPVSETAVQLDLRTEVEVNASFDGHITSRRNQPRTAKAKTNSYQSEHDGDESYLSPEPSKNKKRTHKVIEDDDDDGPTPKKPRKPRAPKSEPVYVIPDVERKETTFKGRLGMCLSFAFNAQIFLFLDFSSPLWCPVPFSVTKNIRSRDSC